GGPALGDEELLALGGSGQLAARDDIRARDMVATPLVPWLLGAALLLALIELLLRRGSAPLWSNVDEESSAPSAPGAAA
ncbi:MAG TPA: hypothetical protein VIR34_13795, partial [Gemmatimonadaceae bacterium]